MARHLLIHNTSDISRSAGGEYSAFVEYVILINLLLASGIACFLFIEDYIGVQQPTKLQSVWYRTKSVVDRLLFVVRFIKVRCKADHTKKSRKSSAQMISQS